MFHELGKTLSKVKMTVWQFQLVRVIATALYHVTQRLYIRLNNFLLLPFLEIVKRLKFKELWKKGMELSIKGHEMFFNSITKFKYEIGFCFFFDVPFELSHFSLQIVWADIVADIDGFKQTEVTIGEIFRFDKKW